MKQFSIDEYLKNPNRKVVTRDGAAVKIICTDFDREYPIVGAINGHKYPDLFTENGCYTSDGTSSPCDLFFAPEKKEKHEGWINLYKNSGGSLIPSRVYQSKEVAKKRGSWHDCYVTTTKIEWEE